MRINKKVAVLVATAAAGASLLVGAGVSNAGVSYCGNGEELARSISMECCGGVHSSGWGAPVACRSRLRHAGDSQQPGPASYHWEDISWW